MRIVVVGAGIIGLSCALRLREAGHDVEVWTADPPQRTTSAVAAALWYPYKALPFDAVTRWSAESYDQLALFTARPESGVALRRGRDLYRAPQPDPWWATAVPRLRRCRADELPAGFVDGFAFAAPVVDMSRFLPWLVDRLADRGVLVLDKAVDSLDVARSAADVVVNCTGLAARELAGDTELVPVRGQVVRLANIGLTDWVLDEDNPDGLVYVVPRGEDVVCGGTADVGIEDRTVDPAVRAAILARCRALVPELADSPVLSEAVGLRPTRPAVRLERVGDIVHCYGHGGAGVTISWGCAGDVVRLLDSTR